MTKLTAPKVPCGSCPYRRDVPSGIWHREEYDKLPKYDGETWEQDPHTFLCHQRDNNICAGWLACHGPNKLLALRFDRDVDLSVFNYTTTVPVFSSGKEAREHGIRNIKNPDTKARKLVSALIRKHPDLKTR